jgi:hypothetical protein
MKTNEIVPNAQSQTPVAVPPATPVATPPPPAAAPIAAVSVTPSAAPANPVAAKPKKGGKKNKAQAVPAKA